MTTTLKQGRNGPILELDPKLLSDAGIDFASPLDVRIEAGRIVAVRRDGAELDAPDPAFDEAMAFTFAEYDETLRKLAE